MRLVAAGLIEADVQKSNTRFRYFSGDVLIVVEGAGLQKHFICEMRVPRNVKTIQEKLRIIIKVNNRTLLMFQGVPQHQEEIKEASAFFELLFFLLLFNHCCSWKKSWPASLCSPVLSQKAEQWLRELCA